MIKYLSTYLTQPPQALNVEKSTTIFQLYHYIYIGKGLQIYLGPHSRDRLVKYPIIKVGENPINTLVLCSRCHMIIDLKQMSSGKEQKKIGQKIMGQKNYIFLSVKVFFVCSDKSLLICVRYVPITP